MDTTELVLSGMGVPPYSARGLRQTLRPIDSASQLRRTINGYLVDLSDANFRKYESTISGEDQQPPAIDGIWPGLQLTVDCIAELAVVGDFSTEIGTEQVTEAILGRSVVPGSVRVDAGVTRYRPRLLMRVVNFQVDQDEWGASIGWSLDLEEV